MPAALALLRARRGHCSWRDALSRGGFRPHQEQPGSSLKDGVRALTQGKGGVRLAHANSLFPRHRRLPGPGRHGPRWLALARRARLTSRWVGGTDTDIGFQLPPDHDRRFLPLKLLPCPLRLVGTARAKVAARAGRQQGAAMLAPGAQQTRAHASNSGRGKRDAATAAIGSLTAGRR